jgi:hypothetical protein
LKHIRLQFVLLLVAVVALFAGAVTVDFLAFERIKGLHALESRSASILLDWNLMVNQSMAILASSDPAGETCAEWKKAYAAYAATWPLEVAEFERLAGGDVHLECPERGTRVVVSLPETFDKRTDGKV